VDGDGWGRRRGRRRWGEVGGREGREGGIG
jgi:hypothetical protein